MRSRLVVVVFRDGDLRDEVHRQSLSQGNQ